MSAALIPFDFESHAVRTVMIDGLPCFVGVDVCRAIEIGKPSNAMARLDDDERVPVVVDTLGGKQTMTGVTESGLYALILTSRKPAAKRFRKWVTSEVIPAIRRDGNYNSLPGADGNNLPVKRAYYATLPDSHRDRAETRAKALEQVEALIADGLSVKAAVAEAALAMGLSERTIYYMRSRTYMVPKSDWEPALAPRWSVPRGMRIDCHPDALRAWLDLRSRPGRYTDRYRRLEEMAVANGWGPIPPIHTMRRADKRAALVHQGLRAMSALGHMKVIGAS